MLTIISNSLQEKINEIVWKNNVFLNNVTNI